MPAPLTWMPNDRAALRRALDWLTWKASRIPLPRLTERQEDLIITLGLSGVSVSAFCLFVIIAIGGL